MFRDVKTDAPDTDDPRAGRLRIAVIGIDRYRKWPRLSNAVNDARGALGAFLRLGFEQIGEPLYDEAATADAIRSLVTDDLAGLSTNDSLVLFFAGHGHTTIRTFHEGDSVKTGYIIPVDGDQPGGSPARWLRLDSWLSDIARLAAKHILVFLDACHSGIALGSLIKWRDSNRSTESFQSLHGRRSRRVITSALDDQRAMDGGPRSGHSLFTGCLLDGLDGAISSPGERVTGSEIGLYLQKRVTSYPDSAQTPDFGALEEDKRGELVIQLSAERIVDRAVLRAAAAGDPSSRFGRSLAVVIGIDGYGDGISPLRSAVADAEVIAEALRRDHGFETWCLLDEDASLARLLALLRERLPAALGPQDRLLFYFAGHGIALAGDGGPAGYLVPARARRSDRDGFLPIRVVHDELARLPVRHALVILDCCFSGALRWPSLREVDPAAAKIFRERYERYLASASWHLLTSASGNEAAFDLLANDRGEGAGTHSPFARALLDGLAGAADVTGDHLITVDSLARFVRERVAPAGPGGQIPQLCQLARHDGGQFMFQVPNRSLGLASAPPLDEADPPYRGLQRFREQDRAVFFGRAAVTGRLVEVIATRQLTVIVGPSGCGKSSLVHAGVLPALRSLDWTVLAARRPGRAPLAVLGTLAEELGAPPGGVEVAAAWLAAAAARASQPWLVVIDQLEELVTHRTEPRDREAFLEALAGALKVSPSLHLVVTVRSDAEPRLRDGGLAPWWAAGRFAVPGMTRDELRQVIEEPATAAVLHFEPSRLVERLLDDVAAIPAPLPALSFALGELHRACRERWLAGDRGRALRETDYDAMGGVAEALTRRATALHDDLVAGDAARSITIRNVFTRMVAASSGELARCRVAVDELVYADPPENQRVADVLNRFAGAGLISPGDDVVEPSHDELVRGWTLVARWLDELDAPAGTRALLGALADAVRSWRAHDRSDAWLWRDARVELVEAIGRARPSVFNVHETRFVQRSVEIRRTRRIRLIDSLRARRHALARSYLELGRQLLLEGRPFEAVPYLVEARRAGASGAPLRMLFSAASRNLTAAPIEHRDQVASAAFSPDGARIVTASHDGTARIWDATTGKPLTPPLSHHGVVWSAAFSPDGSRVVTASDDQTARIWRAATGKLRSSLLEHGAAVLAAAFNRDGTRVVTASRDRTARIWDATSGKPRCPPLEHEGAVRAAAFSADGLRVVTASEDQTARVWDATTGQALSPPLKHRGPVSSVAFSRSGARAVTASEDQTARIWDPTTGQELAASLEHQGSVCRAAFSPDGTRVVTASEDQTARVWDAITGKPVSPPLDHPGAVCSAVFSPDGTRVVTASSDRTARVWDPATCKPLSPALEHRQSVESAGFSPDGTRVVTASSDRTARVWDAATCKPVSPPLEHQDRVLSAGFSPDGTRVVTTSNDRTARVWDATTGRPVSPPLEHQDEVRSAVFSPDGTRIVTASSDRTARVWDAATGAPVSPPLEHQSFVWSAAFSPDGARVITASADNTARVWDATTGAPVSPPLEHQSIVCRAAFDPDGQRVVTASHDRTARIWNATTGEPLSRPLAHGDKVWSAAFSADGARVITASSDHTARVWDAATGAPLSPPLEHRDDVRTAVFSADGTRVVTASEDRTARVWETPLDPGTLADWTAIAERAPYLLVHGVLSLRAPRPG